MHRTCYIGRLDFRDGFGSDKTSVTSEDRTFLPILHDAICFQSKSNKNVINKKCHQKCRAAMAKHPHARIIRNEYIFITTNPFLSIRIQALHVQLFHLYASA